MHCRRQIIILLAIVFVSLPVRASCEKKPLWDLGAGVLLLQMPDYRGSGKNRIYLLPYPYLVYRGDVLKVDKEKVTGRIFKTDRMLMDMSFNGSAPVDSSDNPDRQGMPDLDPTFEVGPSLNITLLKNRQEGVKWALTLPVRAIFSTDFSSVHHRGWAFHPRLNFEKIDMIPGSGVNFGLSAGPMFADSGYNRYFYAVDPGYSTPSRPAYSSGGGYSGSTITVGLNKTINMFVLNAFVSVDLLHGTVFEDSPLVKNKYSVMTGFAVSWIFRKSAEMVDVED